MWQALRTELHPLGVEVVTVGIDAAGPEECRPFIEAAQRDIVDPVHSQTVAPVDPKLAIPYLENPKFDENLPETQKKPDAQASPSSK